MSNFYGLLGEKLGHSFSPVIHGEILKKLNMEGTYNLFEVKKENLPAAVAGLKALGCRGANVTIPYKIEIMAYLDNIAKEAQKIGAVNTIAFSEEGLTGYNTDYYGFGLMLKRAGIELPGKKAVIMGTGGAAKAVLEYLLDNQIGQVVFVSRNPQSAMERIKGHKIIPYSEWEDIENKDMVINCTPRGMYPAEDDSPVGRKVIPKFNIAVDLIYNPIETLFLKYAREGGLVTANGLYMLVAQAAAAQEIWQGTKFSDEFVEELYEKIKRTMGL